MDYYYNVISHYTGLFHNKSVTGIEFGYFASKSTCHGTSTIPMEIFCHQQPCTDSVTGSEGSTRGVRCTMADLGQMFTFSKIIQTSLSVLRQ